MTWTEPCASSRNGVGPRPLVRSGSRTVLATRSRIPAATSMRSSATNDRTPWLAHTRRKATRAQRGREQEKRSGRQRKQREDRSKKRDAEERKGERDAHFNRVGTSADACPPVFFCGSLRRECRWVRATL